MTPRPSLARGTLLNLAGQGLPLLVGLASIPLITSHLGPVRFGLLGIVWGVLGYFSILDLGTGRATTRFVAEALARDDLGAVERLVSLSVLLQVAIGVAGGLALALGTPVLVRVFDVPVALSEEAHGAFYVLAVSLPLVLLSLALRAVLEAAQRFDLVNAIRLPSSVATFLLPAGGAMIGMRLPGIVLLLLAARVIACGVSAWFIGIAIHGFRWRRPAVERGQLRLLASYSGWVAISNFVGPMLLYFDRYLLGSLAGMVAVAYYTGPYEAVTRLLIIPASLAAVLFPAFSSLGSSGRSEAGSQLLAKGVRHLLLVVAVPSSLVVLFAHDLLRLWLGPEYAANGAVALQVLGIGVLLNALAHLPYSYVQAMDRPDLTAKLHLAELAPYAVAAWFLVREYGVAGAALAWTLRASVDALLLFGVALRVLNISPGAFAGIVGARTWFAITAFGLVLAAAGSLVHGAASLISAAALATGVFIAASWWLVLDAGERAAFLSALRLRLGP